SEICDPKPSALSYLKNEHICGRPLGLRFDKKTGDLYIADAYLGLFKVGPEGGLATSLTTEAEGVPLWFTNDLDMDEEGNVYFTDSSNKYQRRNFLQLVFSGDNSGRVLKYDPKTKETTVLVRNIQFPNGLSLSKDGSFFVYCEGSLGRKEQNKFCAAICFVIVNLRSATLKDDVKFHAQESQHQSGGYVGIRNCLQLQLRSLSKYWLKGEKAGTSEVLAILPGFPDNVRTNEKGEFWVGIHCRQTIYAYLCALYPKARKFILKFPISAKIQFLLQIGGWPSGVVAKYSPEGKLLQILEDSQGKVVKAVSEVEEKDGKLWMGSVLMPFIAVYDLN
ncbi:Strictosidine synthase, partial [Parasponia andersonii]